MGAAVAEALGLAEPTPELQQALANARRGERTTALLQGGGSKQFRLLASPLSADGARIRVVLAPTSRSNEGLVEVAAAVSHEVANAVGSIRGWAELALHNGDVTVNMRDALSLIRGAARSAEQAARSMLNIARGEEDAEQPQRVDMSEFAQEFVQLLTLAAREARVTLESSIERGLVVRAARSKLFTIVFNLVKNAIEACAPGGLVSVHVKAEQERVVLTVRDTGKGLDQAGKRRLFERYYTTKPTGTGLGLVLVRAAVEASAGEISVESELGRGTLFRVSFPRLEQAALEGDGWSTGRREVLAPGPAGQALDARVLVVDDDHALREMVATALSLRGAQVVTVGSVEQARALEGQFDIALIDMMLEGCRGDELLALLRHRGVVHAAMLVTGTVQKPRLVPGGEPDDWVRKPFEISHLVERIRRTLERHHMLDRAGSAARV